MIRAESGEGSTLGEHTLPSQVPQNRKTGCSTIFKDRPRSSGHSAVAVLLGNRLVSSPFSSQRDFRADDTLNRKENSIPVLGRRLVGKDHMIRVLQMYFLNWSLNDSQAEQRVRAGLRNINRIPSHHEFLHRQHQRRAALSARTPSIHLDRQTSKSLLLLKASFGWRQGRKEAPFEEYARTTVASRQPDCSHGFCPSCTERSLPELCARDLCQPTDQEGQ